MHPIPVLSAYKLIIIFLSYYQHKIFLLSSFIFLAWTSICLILILLYHLSVDICAVHVLLSVIFCYVKSSSPMTVGLRCLCRIPVHSSVGSGTAFCSVPPGGVQRGKMCGLWSTLVLYPPDWGLPVSPRRCWLPGAWGCFSGPSAPLTAAKEKIQLPCTAQPRLPHTHAPFFLSLETFHLLPILSADSSIRTFSEPQHISWIYFRL